MNYEQAKQRVDKIVSDAEKSAPDPQFKCAFALGVLSGIATDWLAELHELRVEVSVLRQENRIFTSSIQLVP